MTERKEDKSFKVQVGEAIGAAAGLISEDTRLAGLAWRGYATGRTRMGDDVPIARIVVLIFAV